MKLAKRTTFLFPSSTKPRLAKEFFICAGFLLGLAASFVLSPAFFDVVVHSIADVYLQVSVFVFFTLALYYGFEKWLDIDLMAFVKSNARYQVPVAAILGALPGCGGAIVVITAFAKGSVSFGAVTAVLVATMGDAAFLLIAKAPSTALFVVGVSLVVALISGYLVDKLHTKEFLLKSPSSPAKELSPFVLSVLQTPWLLMTIPGVVLGFLTALQIDVDSLLGIQNFSLVFGSIGGILSLLLWLANCQAQPFRMSKDSMSCSKSRTQKIILDTCFVSLWVVIAFVIFEVWVAFFGLDLHSLFSAHLVYLPLLAVIIGFIPGCGPQILVTSLFLGGYIPLSAMLGNAISNDGDALFPALAISFQASLLATLYSAIPALLVAYGYFWLFE